MTALLSFLEANLDKLGLFYQVIETGSIYRENQTPQLFQKIYKIREKFNAIGILFGALSFCQILAIQERRWGLLRSSIQIDFRGTLLLIGLAAGALIGLAKIVSYLANKLFAPKANIKELLAGLPADKKPNIQLNWENSPKQEIAQIQLVTRLIANLTIAYFNSSPYFLLATVALEAFSFISLARRKWLCYEQTFTRATTLLLNNLGQVEEVQHWDPRLQAVKFRYYFPFLKALGNKNDNCGICLEDQGSFIQACSQHALHDACVPGAIFTALDRFNSPGLFFWLLKFKAHTRFEMQKNRVTTSIKYGINIAKEILPTCLLCRDQPVAGELEVFTKDSQFPNTFTQADIQILDKV